MHSLKVLCLFLICISAQGLAIGLPEEYEAQVRNYPDIMQSKERCLPQQGNYEFASTLVCDPSGLLSVAQKTRELRCKPKSRLIIFRSSRYQLGTVIYRLFNYSKLSVSSVSNSNRIQRSIRNVECDFSSSSAFLCLLGTRKMRMESHSSWSHFKFNMLNSKLHHIKTSVNFDKPSCDVNNPRPVIGVAIVKKVEVDNMDEDRLLSYAAIFSYYLFNKWNLPSHCHSESGKIIILYSKDDGVIYTIAGNLLRRKLTAKHIHKIAIQSRVQFSTSISDGIAYIIEKYREAVESRSKDLFEKAK
ncbi:expressed conserved protein [Schistosoma japonicum]|nr:expressed conserved protein [Schistosoma japonicum]KAH8864752.1 expressed conserved protein [Schistosoma japonicum]